MISVIGIGDTANSILSLFEKHQGYDCHSITDGKSKNKNFISIPKKKTHQEYETEVDVSFMSELFLDEKVYVFVSGKDKVSALTLKVLDGIQNKKIEVYYIKPITMFLSPEDFKFERIIRSVLQEYARSGKFEKITLIDLEVLEKMSAETPLNKFYDAMFETIVGTIAYAHLVERTAPVLDNEMEKPIGCRIATLGFCSIEDWKENVFYCLPEKHYSSYVCILTQEMYENDASLTRRIFGNLQKKQQEQKECLVSYKIILTDAQKGTILIEQFVGETESYYQNEVNKKK